VVAELAGVDAATLRATRREAAALGARWAAIVAWREDGVELPPGVEDVDLTAAEWSLLEFGRALAQARAWDEVERGEVIHATAMGERKRTIVTTKHRVEQGEDGAEKLVPVEMVERVEEIAPDPAALMKVQERLYPERWGQVDRRETTVSGTVNVVHADAKDLVASVRARLSEAEERRATAIEVEGGPVDEEPLPE